MRLNGWQRMWVVVGFASQIAVVVYSVRAANFGERIESPHKVASGFEAPECEYIRKLPDGVRLAKEPSATSPCYHLYAYKLYNASPAKNAVEYRERVSAEWWSTFWNSIVAFTVMWAIGMALLYGAGATVAWIIRGFRGNE